MPVLRKWRHHGRHDAVAGMVRLGDSPWSESSAVSDLGKQGEGVAVENVARTSRLLMVVDPTLQAGRLPRVAFHRTGQTNWAHGAGEALALAAPTGRGGWNW